MSDMKREFWGGRRGRKGDCGGRGEKIHHQLGPKGFDLNAVE